MSANLFRLGVILAHVIRLWIKKRGRVVVRLRKC